MHKLNPMTKLYHRLQRWVLDKTIGRQPRAPVRMENRKTGYAVNGRWFRTYLHAEKYCVATGLPCTHIVNLNPTPV